MRLLALEIKRVLKPGGTFICSTYSSRHMKEISELVKGFDDRIKNMLLLMMAETCREFEKLPIIKYADILRNILYSGVWCRFESISRKRREEREKEDV